MSERAYRERLEADLARWQAEGLLPPKSADAIRATLRPVPEGITIATVVGIVGGLLIAAAFLAFIAANWTAIARPLRFAILLAGIVGAYGVAALFDRAERDHLADLSVGVGSIIFGAAIALVGQMYHLGDDFAGGLLVWASGALAAAALTGSHSALAVALAAGCVWSGMRVDEMSDMHPQFGIFWLIAATLALSWRTTAARHLVAVAAIVGAFLAGVGVAQARIGSPNFTFVALVSFMIGAGLFLTTRRQRSDARVRAHVLDLRRLRPCYRAGRHHRGGLSAGERQCAVPDPGDRRRSDGVGLHRCGDGAACRGRARGHRGRAGAGRGIRLHHDRRR